METIYIQNIGEIKIDNNSKAKRIKLSIKPFIGLVLTIPTYSNQNQALKFIELKKDWIQKALLKVEKIENKYTVFDENTIFKTKKHDFKLIRNQSKTISLSVSNNLILVRVPFELNCRDEQVQIAARKGIEFALKKESKEYIPQRVYELASKFNLKYTTVSIRSSKSRWGSCSSSNSLNFSLHLMRLPDALIDYVILHELAHTIVKNHSPKFWSFLDSICINSKELDKEIGLQSTIYF